MSGKADIAQIFGNDFVHSSDLLHFIKIAEIQNNDTDIRQMELNILYKKSNVYSSKICKINNFACRKYENRIV